MGKGDPLFAKGGNPVLNGLLSSETTDFLLEKAKGYVWPRFGHAAEVRSLIAHTKLFLSVNNVPMDYVTEHVVANKMCQTFAPARLGVPSDFMTRAHFDRVFENLDMTSSPGLPYIRVATTNKLLFCDKNGVVIPEKKEWLWAQVESRLKDESFDPIRFFVKAEPIKQEKLEQGRFRLIASISVVDQVIDQMIFGWQNEAIKDVWDQVPPKVGWSQMLGGWKIVPSCMRIAIDKKAWDWTVKEWMLEAEFKLRLWLCHENPLFQKLATWRYRCLYEHPLLVTSSGVVLRQEFIGIMKSGSVNTIMSNSIMQVILHYRVCVELGQEPGFLWSMGDDTLQSEPDDLDQYMNRLREYCLAKDPVRAVEFAGFEFGPGFTNPMYPAKHAFNLLYFDPRFAQDMVNSYSLLYTRSTDSGWVFRTLSELGEAPTSEFLRMVWNGDE